MNTSCKIAPRWRLENPLDKPLPVPELTQIYVAIWHHLATMSYTLEDYRRISNIRRTLVGNKIVDHSDVVGAAPVGAAPTTSSLLT